MQRDIAEGRKSELEALERRRREARPGAGLLLIGCPQLADKPGFLARQMLLALVADALRRLPAETDLRTLAATIKARWVCEQAHQQLKEELGLDYFDWNGDPLPRILTRDDPLSEWVGADPSDWLKGDAELDLAVQTLKQAEGYTITLLSCELGSDRNRSE